MNNFGRLNRLYNRSFRLCHAKIEVAKIKKNLSKGTSYEDNPLNHSKYNDHDGHKCQCVIDESCQRATEMLNETTVVCLFAVAGAPAA